MIRLTRRPLFAAGWGLFAYLAVVAWTQTSGRGIAAALYVPVIVDGFPVSASGFESLHGELLKAERLRREGGGL